MKSCKCVVFSCLGTLLFALSFVNLGSAQDEAKSELVKALIVDGQNNHGIWPKTSRMMKQYLEESGRFSVEIARTAPKGTDPNFRPRFQDYDVVVSNYNGAAWPDDTKSEFVEYMKGGGGLVVIHAADNAFGDWPEYNEMIGLGGWGGRNERSGPLVYLDGDGKEVRDKSEGRGGSHGAQHSFSVVSRNDRHPIMKGLPSEWMHSKDELYDRLRGPASNMTVLATSFSSPKFGGSGRHEPMMMTIEYGKGRVFHTPMGHADYSQECVGFITVLLRGTEWAGTGEVTLPVPEDFPTADKLSEREFHDSLQTSALGDTRNVTRVGDLYLAGQPTQADIDVIKAAGIRHVITLRQASEVEWDEEAAVEEAGLKFHRIEFQKPDELTDQVFDQVRELLKKTSNEKVLLHCGSANRVGAVWSVCRALDEGMDIEQAIREAKKVGLRSEGYEKRANQYISNGKK